MIATPIYVSQSSFVIKSPGQKSSTGLSLANLVQTTGISAGQEQTKEVIQYIRSRDALNDLAAADGRSCQVLESRRRFPESASPGPFLQQLIRKPVSILRLDGRRRHDADSGLAVVEVKAFTPEDAYELTSRLLDLSEQLVNRLNERAEGRAIAEAERRVVSGRGQRPNCA